MMKPQYKEGEPVFIYGPGDVKQYGTIHKNTKHPEVSEWYIKLKDGRKVALLDEWPAYKVNQNENI